MRFYMYINLKLQLLHIDTETCETVEIVTIVINTLKKMRVKK